jgi:hypothetical protein
VLSTATAPLQGGDRHVTLERIGRWCSHTAQIRNAHGLIIHQSVDRVSDV